MSLVENEQLLIVPVRNVVLQQVQRVRVVRRNLADRRRREIILVVVEDNAEVGELGRVVVGVLDPHHEGDVGAEGRGLGPQQQLVLGLLRLVVQLSVGEEAGSAASIRLQVEQVRVTPS